MNTFTKKTFVWKDVDGALDSLPVKPPTFPPPPASAVYIQEQQDDGGELKDIRTTPAASDVLKSWTFSDAARRLRVEFLAPSQSLILDLQVVFVGTLTPRISLTL